MNPNENNVFDNHIKPLIVSISCIALTQLIAVALSWSNKGNFNLMIIAFATIAVQWISFIHASGLFGNQRTEKFFDLTGSLTYILAIAYSYFNIFKPSLRQKIASSFVLIWAIRLGWFLFARISHNKGEDRRFTHLKTTLLRFLQVWSVQGVWVFITALSVLLLNESSDESELNILNYIGISVWIFGFSFEVISDFQKKMFKSDDLNNGKFISSGLWSFSRHPNYFGEMTLWFGMYLLTISNYKSIFQLSTRIISPLFVSLLLIYVSGIPLLEKHADNLYGHLEEYEKYKKVTPVLVPIIGRKGNAKF